MRKLPDGAQVELSVSGDGNKIAIKSGQSRFSLATLPVDDFPVMAEGDLSYNFTIKSAECSALVEKPSFAISTEETRYYLNGIYLHTSGTGAGKVLRAVATDGHRLARIEVALPAGADGMPGVIVPRKAIYELKKLLEEGEGDVQISLSDTKIRFAFGNAVLVSKLIDGNFPDYERVSPVNNDKIMEVDCKLFAQADKALGVIDAIVPEPLGGAHRDPAAAIRALGDAIAQQLESLAPMDTAALKADRRTKFLTMGRFA